MREYLPRAGEEELRGFEWRYWWRVSRGQQLHTLRGHSNRVYCVVWSPDGNLIASASDDRTVKLWNAENATVLLLRSQRGWFAKMRLQGDAFTLHPCSLSLRWITNAVAERNGFLIVGRAGVDGIGYRRDRDGIGAHYPIEDDFRKIGPSISALVEGWRNGSVTV